jgi:diguanylate cyclase (GGDEF)-like protein/PAS domain S-box-containing protein
LRYRKTVDEAPIGIAHTDLQGRLLRVNPTLCNLLGYSEPELLYRATSTLTYPDDRAYAAETRKKLLEDAATPPAYEARVIRKDGDLVWLQCSLTLIRAPDGTPDYFVSIVEDITQRKQSERLLRRQAQYDALTGLPNRIVCQDRLSQALLHARRRACSTGVLFMDLDGFKLVNDTLGHDTGDRLLQEAARRFSASIRAEDTVARVGGDEFVVILHELSEPGDAALVAQKIVASMREPFRLDTHESFVNVSIGIAVFPNDGEDNDTLLRHADMALHQAKASGRNNHQFYTAAMNNSSLERLLLENDLRRALERDEFTLHYQPKVSLASGAVTGFEALLRWHRNSHGAVSPGVFIPVLERSGMMVQVGDWAIDAVCAQLAAWRRTGLPVRPVAVNLSARQFLHHDIAQVIATALERHGVPPELFEVEVTESDAMANVQETARVLEGLRARRIRVAIDDFGTGYSSLAYLKRLPVDTLKLDRSFITGLPADADDASITRAVLTMAHNLGLSVVAEGVETEAQRRFLAEQACDEMQGFLFSRPLPAAQCAELLTRSTAPALEFTA